jgi:hydrogenase/urease accessory protein HupE
MTANRSRACWALPGLLALLALGLAGRAHAHPLSPPVLTVREQGAQHYRVSFRRSPLAAARLELDWPLQCRVGKLVERRQDDQLVADFELSCGRPLSGQTLRVFGLVELELSLLVYVELERVEPVRALLSAERTSLTFPRRESSWALLRDYVALGVQHLLTGPDHILFVLGLLLLVRGLRARLWALTAFTLGHSVTLCLSALSVIRLPQAPVELGIALSLLVVALEVLAQREGELRAPRPVWLLASGFGLLHGLGFASALVEAGLPKHAVPLSLLGFNVGVELGQLLVVLLLAPLLWALEKLCVQGRGASAQEPSVEGRAASTHEQRSRRVRVLAAYSIGALAAMWCIERALALCSWA